MDNSDCIQKSRFATIARAFAGYLEATLWCTGILLLAGFSLTLTTRAANTDRALSEFQALQTQALRSESEHAVQTAQNAPSQAPASGRNLLVREPDKNLWSIRRVEAYQKASASGAAPPAAVLRAPALNLTTPVYARLDSDILDKGAGWIESTSALNQTGNIGIAAHRDSFFRALKDVKPGMTFILQTLTQTRTYRVSETQVVTPDEVRVLKPSEDNRLTLVTCYPFYFIGHAPKRFIVTAIEDEAVQPHL